MNASPWESERCPANFSTSVIGAPRFMVLRESPWPAVQSDPSNEDPGDSFHQEIATPDSAGKI